MWNVEYNPYAKRYPLRNDDEDFLQVVPQYEIPEELTTVLTKHLKQFDQTRETKKWNDFITNIPDLQLDKLEDELYFTTLTGLLYLEEFYNSDSSSKRIIIKLVSTRHENRFQIKLKNLDKELCFLETGITVDIEKIENKKTKVLRNLKKFSLTIIEVDSPIITVKADLSFQLQHEKDNEYFMDLEFSNWPLRVCHYAMEKIEKYNILNFMSAFEKRLVENEHDEDTTSFHVTVWFDQNIKTNPEQVQAVRQIVNKTAYPSPYIVFGPPGTGKTATIVEAVSQIYRLFGNSNILICTPSNAAADEVAKRLLQNVPKEIIFRMTSPSADLNDVDTDVFLCMNMQGGKPVHLPVSILKDKRIVISTLVSCARLLRLINFTNHFNYIFIDEAGQATQPETFIPFAMLKFHKSQIVMSGDPKQLGPVVLTKQGQHLLKTSMLERLMDTSDLYQKGKDNKYNANFITKLVKNYRSHEAILKLPNKMFYANELVVSGSKAIHSLENWSHLPKKGFPIIFHEADGDEEKNKLQSSKNLLEAIIVLDYLEKLLNTKIDGFKITERNIGIVTPFKYQSSTITEMLENKGWNKISVGTVESFQGQERDIIIVSTVRSTVFQSEGKSHIGFLCDEKRFNVTITRARFLLIVIGNPDVLKIDTNWHEFINFCRNNQACCSGINITLLKDCDPLGTYRKPQSSITLQDFILEKTLKNLKIKKT